MVIERWKARMHSCLGLPLGRVANTSHPRVTFITRPLAHGRGFVNVYEVAKKLEVRMG